MTRTHRHPLPGTLVMSFLVVWELGCSAPSVLMKPAPPDWVTGKSQKYPVGEYLIGVGYGDDRRSAEDSAYGAISRIFQADIQSRTREWEEYLQSSDSMGDSKSMPQVSRRIFMDQLTQVSTRKVLENVSIAEVWTDSKTGGVYALAVVDRAHAASVIRSRINELDQQAQTLIQSVIREGIQDQPGPGRSRLEIPRTLYKGFKLLIVREGLNADLKVISPAGQGVDPRIPLAQVAEMLRRSLTRDLLVALEVSGAHADRIRLAVLNGLTRKGLRIIDPSVDRGSENGTGAVLVKGGMELEPVQLQDRPFFRWIVRFVLIDQTNNQVLGSVERAGREGHLQADEAEARAVRAAQRVVEDEIGPALAAIVLDE